METEPLAEVKVDLFTICLTATTRCSLFCSSVPLISFSFSFGTASQFPSNPTDATTCFIFTQTTADLSKDPVLNGVFL